MKYLKTLLLSALLMCTLVGCEEDIGRTEQMKQENLAAALKEYISSLKSNGETDISAKISTYLHENYEVSIILEPIGTNSIDGPDPIFCQATTTTFYDPINNETWKIREYKKCGDLTNCVRGSILTAHGFEEVYTIC